MNRNNYTFYMYEVTWCNEYDEAHPWAETVTKGLICADSFGDAVCRIEASFDEIVKVNVESINDSELLDLEDLLCFMNPDANRGSTLGPQLIAALEEAIEVENAELENDN